MAKSYEITFVNGIKVIQRLTQVQLYDIIRKYKVRGYKLIWKFFQKVLDKSSFIVYT